MRLPHLSPLSRALALSDSCAVGLRSNVAGTAHKDLTDQFAEPLREDVKYRRKWCENIRLGFDPPGNVSEDRCECSSKTP